MNKSVDSGGRLTVNYADSLQEMTKSLYVYNDLFTLKTQEKASLLSHIIFLRLSLKHISEESTALRAEEADVRRDMRKVKRVSKRKGEENYFSSREIQEIRA